MYLLIKNILYLLDYNKVKLPLFICLFIFSSLFDLIGIGLIGPYISIIVENQNQITDFYFANLLNKFIKFDNKQELIIIISIFLIITFFIKTLLAILITKLIIDFGVNQKIFIQNKIMKSYISQNYLDYTKRNTSNYVNSIINFSDHYRGALLTLLKTLSELVIALAIICFLFFINFIAVIFLLIIFLSIIFIYNLVFKQKLKSYGVIVNKTADQSLKKVNEIFDGFKELTISNKKFFFYKIFMQNIYRNGLYYKKQLLISSIPRYILEFILVVLITTSVLSYVYFDLNLVDLLPVLAMFGISGIRLIPSVNIIINGITTGRFLSNSIENLKNDLTFYENKDFNISNNYNKNDIENISDKFETIEFKNVSFNFPGRSIILKDINFKLNKGENIVIIGSSGSGKTTFIDLILGLIKPMSGEILYNGKKIKDLMNYINKQTAYITQDTFLIDGSIKSNIALGIEDNKIDLQKLEKCIYDAHLSELVNQLPHKKDTNIGERGIQLSGGQKQRIVLARALYFQKNILVLDEATNALDTNTEKEIYQTINNLKLVKTIILITHSLSNNFNYDKIYKIYNNTLNEEKK